MGIYKLLHLSLVSISVSKTDSVTLKNTYLNNFEIYNFYSNIFFIFEEHCNIIFSSYTYLEKVGYFKSGPITKRTILMKILVKFYFLNFKSNFDLATQEKYKKAILYGKIKSIKDNN